MTVKILHPLAVSCLMRYDATLMKIMTGLMMLFWILTLLGCEGRQGLKNCLAPASVFTAELEDWELIALRFSTIALTAREGKDLSPTELDFLKGIMHRLNGKVAEIDQNDPDFTTGTLVEMEYLLKRATDSSGKSRILSLEQKQTAAFIIGQVSNEIVLHDMSHFMRYFSFLSITLEDPSLKKNPDDLETARQIINLCSDLNEKQMRQRNILRHFLLQNNTDLAPLIYQDLKNSIKEGYELGLRALEIMKRSEMLSDYIPFIEADKRECEEFFSMLERWEKNPESLRHSAIHAYNESLGILKKLKDFHSFDISLLTATPFNLELKMAAHELYYLFFTFCDNAKDAKSPERDLKLSIGVSEVEKDNRLYCKIVVADNGKGMTPQVLQTLRDGIKITTKGKMGSGVGLDSIRNLLTSLGGSWNIQSTEGKGTTFTLFIPGVKGSKLNNLIIKHSFKIDEAA